MADAARERAVLLHVLVEDTETRIAVERCLLEGGFGVTRRGPAPVEVPMGTIAEAVTITRRDQEVLQALATHDSSKEIAKELGITDKTVDDRIQRLMDKLDVHSRHRLLLKAVVFGLVSVRAGT